MPNAKDAFFKGFTAVHKSIFVVSKGRLLGKFYGMPAVILTTTGRKTGQKRDTMLTAPLASPDRVVLVASFGGDDRNPAWFLNLRANPAVEVTMGGSKRPMTARVATAEEKAELWPQVVASYKGYANYQSKTDRDIPLVILEP